VDLPAGLLAHVHDLTVSIGQDDQDLGDTVAALTTALRATATSYCGFQLTIVENQLPVTLTAFTDEHDVPVGTSLRLPLGLVSRVDGDSRIVFFAGTPGAFTDLAADLSYALGESPLNSDHPPRITRIIVGRVWTVSEKQFSLTPMFHHFPACPGWPASPN
jgi:hypothetical protein